MALNVDSARATKTLIRYLFYFNIIYLICIKIWNVRPIIAVIVNSVILLMQVLMDAVEGKVPSVLEKDTLATKVNNWAKK